MEKSFSAVKKITSDISLGGMCGVRSNVLHERSACCTIYRRVHMCVCTDSGTNQTGVVFLFSLHVAHQSALRCLTHFEWLILGQHGLYLLRPFPHEMH